MTAQTLACRWVRDWAPSLDDEAPSVLWYNSLVRKSMFWNQPGFARCASGRPTVGLER